MLTYSQSAHKILHPTCTPLFDKANFSQNVSSIHSVSVSNVFTRYEKKKKKKS